MSYTVMQIITIILTLLMIHVLTDSIKTQIKIRFKDYSLKKY